MLLPIIISNIVIVTSFDLNDKIINDLEDNNIIPEYYSIVVNDVADIINDFNSDMKWPLGEFYYQEKDEDITDLLSKYQHHLEKAQKQRRNYAERKKILNRKPIVKDLLPNVVNDDIFDTLGYLKPSNTLVDFNLQNYIMPESIVDILIPIPTNINALTTSTIYPETVTKFSTDEELLTKSSEKYGVDYEKTKPTECICQNIKILSNFCCYKNGQSNDYKLLKDDTQTKRYFPFLLKNLPKDLVKYTNSAVETVPKNLKIHMNIDMEIPMSDNSPEKYKYSDRQMYNEDQSIVMLPLPIHNFLNPLEEIITTFKTNIDNYNLVHNKKKSRNNNNRRHRKKGGFTFQHFRVHGKNKLSNSESTTNVDNYQKEKIKFSNENITNKIDLPKEMLLTLNFTVESDNKTEPLQIDHTESPDDTETIVNSNTTENVQTYRLKRHLVTKHKDIIDISKNTYKDENLLYWPNISAPYYKLDLNDANLNEHELIISIINKITTGNDTKALDNILNKLNWNDVNTVTYVFNSFFRKYFNGVLTFCSDDTCKSIKCSEKMCIQRSCLPVDRQNQKGHCNKFNKTDIMSTSDFTLEASRLVQILNMAEDKLLGNIYGKGTFCINSKCTTIIASKKNYFSAQCIAKMLNNDGHCLFTQLEHNTQVI